MLLLALGACTEKHSGSVTEKQPGFLSFKGCNLEVDETVQETKAEPASGSYAVIITDNSSEAEPIVTTYNNIKAAGNKISLTEGTYTVTARSDMDDVPVARFEYPVYGASKSVSIMSGQTTELGEMICKLLQVKVTVSYSDEFLAMVTGECKTTVSVASGAGLDYKMTYLAGAVTYDQSAGYFAVNNGSNTTMEVVFKGSVDGGSKTQTITFTNVKPCTWHQIKFVKKVAEEGSSDFEIVIEDLVEDVELDSDVAGVEAVIGEDPDAPKGDGGIMLKSTCDYDITHPIVVPAQGNSFVLTMKATVPNGVLKFSVDISSDNPDFVGSVKMINDQSATLDLVNPSDGAISVFTTILPFPYGDQVAGKTEINFDLSDAQIPILAFKGTHIFTMNVMDKTGCKKAINVQMVVE